MSEGLQPEGAAAAAVAETSAGAAACAVAGAAQEGALEAPRLQAQPGEVARAVDETGVVCRTHVGGQALIEGVMMRGRYNWALAVREPSGRIHTEEHDLASGRDKNSWMYRPVVRGCTSLIESMALGYKALEIAAEHAFEDEDEPEGRDAAAGEHGGDCDSVVPLDELAAGGASLPVEAAAGTAPGGGIGDAALPDAALPEAALPEAALQEAALPEADAAPENTPPEGQTAPEQQGGGLPKPLMTASMIVGVLLGLGIFIVLPAVVTNLLVGDYGERTLVWNLVDGAIRVAVFILYIWGIGRMPDIKRMFSYHGAEHKAIHCYEHGLKLTVGNARGFGRLHVRCGTAFLIMTMIIAILVFTLVPVNMLIDLLGVSNDILRLALVIVSRVILLPLVAGLSYEVTVKWAGSRPGNPLVRVILWPGLQMQRLTTNEPDDEMLECAIAAMSLVLEREQLEQAKQLDAGTAGSVGKAA